MSVKSAGSLGSRQSQGSRKPGSKDNNSDCNDSLEPKVAIVESYGEDQSYKYSFTYEKATLYEFKYEKSPHPASIDPCFRCNRRIPKPDQVDIGILFHKQCFRCRICGMPLTLRTYCRNDGNTGDEEIYCRTHLGKKVSQIRSGEVAPMGIEGPVSGPGKKYVFQTPAYSVTGSTNRALPPSMQQNNNITNNAGVAGTPVKRSPDRTPPPPPPPRQGDSFVSLTPHGDNLNDTSVWGSSPDASMEVIRTPGYINNHHQQAAPYQQYRPHQQQHHYYQQPVKPGPHPTSILRSYEDFENAHVFESQRLLEQRHKNEDERLLRFLLEEREKELQRLDDTVENEKEKAAEDLLASIENLSVNSMPRNLIDERDRIEEHFKQVKEERLKSVTEKIATEEKARSGKMIDRQCHEMLTLIGEKDREIDRMTLFDHSMKPPSEPPEGKKSSLYTTPSIFQGLDLRAIECANKDYDNFTDLVCDLTRACRTELEKARVLFRWVIAKDVNKHTVNEILRPHAMDRLLKGVKSGKETYHQLYKKLCSYAGLHCEIVLGYSKGAGYKPGMRIDGQSFRNSWTVVNIDGSWRLVNCTWAARHVTGHKDNLPQMYHKYDEFYFLTDPEDHIYQHYPDDPCWQLLEIPLPFSEFVNIPVVKSPFFNYGLQFYSNYGATLVSDTGMVEIRLVVPKILGFGSLLEPVNRLPSEPKQIEGRTLLRFINNEAIFTLALPNPGLYYFSIYTGDYWRSECLESACSFLVHCTGLNGNPAPPYPPVPFFGPTPVMENLGITADSHVDPLVVCNSDYIEINFTLSKDSRITHTFQSFDVSDGAITDIDRFVFLRSRNDKGANYLIRCPKEGFFIFSLYAADLSADSHSLDCAFRYLIVCQEPSPNVAQFPKTYQKWHRCSLHEPLTGDLRTERRVNFKMDIPEASEVFVVVGEVWNHLKRKVGCSWEGQVETGSNSGLAKVYARFAGPVKDSSVFLQMLDYHIVQEEETEI